MSAPAVDASQVLASRRKFLLEEQRRERIVREQLQRQKNLIDAANPGQVTHQSESLARQIRDSRVIDSWLGRTIRALPKDGSR